MPLINLIQEQRLAIKRDERKSRSYFFAFAGIGVLSAMGFFAQMIETDALDGKEKTLQAEIQRVRPLLNQIQANERAYNDMSPKVSTLEDAQASTARWDRVLDHLAKQTPAKVWLTAIRCTAPDPEKPVAVTFTGLAPSQDPIGEYILRLQNSSDLEEVNLKYTQEKIVQQEQGIEFEIDANIADSAQKKDAVKQEGQ
jgi:Tfp pilus assembly protein PilN